MENKITPQEAITIIDERIKRILPNLPPVSQMYPYQLFCIMSKESLEQVINDEINFAVLDRLMRMRKQYEDLSKFVDDFTNHLDTIKRGKSN